MTAPRLSAFSLLTAACLAFAAVSARADGFDDMRAVWNARQIGVRAGEVLEGPMARLRDADCAQAGKWLALMATGPEAKALWPDLADWDNAWSYRVSANMTSNYKRLAQMTLMWATPGCKLQGDPQLRAALLRGLDWMEARHYHAGMAFEGNWWDWQIGSPLFMLNALALMGDAVPPELLARQLAAIDFMMPDPRRRRRPDGSLEAAPETGANLLDKVQVLALRGMVGKSAAKVAAARDALAPALRYVRSGDGFYADGSFIQHGHVPYAGNYGIVALENMARLIALFGAGPWPIRDPELVNVYAWARDAFIPLVIDGALVHTVRGRKVSNPGDSDHGKGRSVAAAVAELAQSAPPDMALQLRAALKGWMARDRSFGPDYAQGAGAGRPSLYGMRLLRAIQADPLVPAAPEAPGVRLFASMDRAILRGPGFGLAFSLFSPRVSAFSYGNRENARGWWSGVGMLSLYNADQAQFDGAFWPTVDSQRLPGTTTDHSAGGTPVEWKPYLNKAGWAGGATLDGNYGVLGMAFSMADVTGSDLRGNKAWFLFGDKVLALGGGIRASRPAETIVENRRLAGGGGQTLLVDGRAVATGEGRAIAFDAPVWAHLAGNVAGAGIGYCFPQRQPMVALRELRSGSWSDINEKQSAQPLRERYLSLALPHAGAAGADGASYSYILMPGASAEQTAVYCARPSLRVEDNTADVAAVSDAGPGLYAAAFWEGGRTAHLGGAAMLGSDRPATVIAQQRDGQLRLSVAEPTQRAAQLTLEWHRPVAAVLSADPAFEVLQLQPTLRLRVTTADALGRSFEIRLALPPAAPGK